MENDETHHYDFTTVSDMEIFIARIEEILQEWKLTEKLTDKSIGKNYVQPKEWGKTGEAITFADLKFLLVRYHAKCADSTDEKEEEKQDEEDSKFSGALDDLMSFENDFLVDVTHPEFTELHPLARWYGLQDFIVLISARSPFRCTESEIKLLLSCLSIAASNTNCQVPLFVELNSGSYYFLGVCQSRGFHTDFEMIHLNRIPLHCQYLTGLLTLFKSKIVGGTTNPISITAQFTYVLKDWTLDVSTQNPSDLDLIEGENIGVPDLGTLPFGAFFDQVETLNLYAIWPYLAENTVVDSENYSDLEPMKAPLWKVSVGSTGNGSYLLTEYFLECLSISTNTSTAYDLLGNVVENPNSRSSDLSSSLSALTESRISAFSKAVLGSGSEKNSGRQSKRSEQVEGPLSSDVLMLLLYYLFPDADSQSKSLYPGQYSGNSFSKEEFKPDHADPRLSGLRSAPYDSLPWRLATVMAHVINKLGGVESATYLWYEFTQELRFRFERSILIPGLDPIYPDPRTCLLNQKLQLLNCCILKKIERGKRERKGEDDSDSDEEFYDCPSETDVSQDEVREVKSSDKPTGRLTRLGELRLLQTGEFLYIPKTQEPIPKTEDQLREDAEVLLRLGTDSHGSELRARLMSASLLSDMEAFKAANPGCILADFIRWYSPRDWIVEEGVDEYGQPKGHLSSRMEIPGNTWLEVWEIAQPIPAKWQRRLFNDTRESEKVLDFFEQQNPKGYMELLLPVMSVCMIHKIIEESADEGISTMEATISGLIKTAERLQRFPDEGAKRYKQLLYQIQDIEMLLTNFKSLKRKFLLPKNEEITDRDREEVLSFVNSLLTGNQIEVPGGPRSRLGSVIQHYFSRAAKAEQMKPDQTSALTEQKWNVPTFPFPLEKEIILRVKTTKGPQRLHAVLRENNYRICGAFTKDDTFL